MISVIKDCTAHIATYVSLMKRNIDLRYNLYEARNTPLLSIPTQTHQVFEFHFMGVAFRFNLVEWYNLKALNGYTAFHPR